MSVIIIPIIMLLILSLCRVPVIASIIFSAITAGLLADQSIQQTLISFNQGIQQGASIALSYALLGSFAAALAKTTIPDVLCIKASRSIRHHPLNWHKSALLVAIAGCAVCSQNLIPIHIAFIPVLIPPLLMIFNQLNLDRRLIACTLTFGLVTTYMFIPMGFGAIYLQDILLGNLEFSGLKGDDIHITKVMAMPILGMCSGLLIAIAYTYKKPRVYQATKITESESSFASPSQKSYAAVIVAIITTVSVQLYANSMILGALMGFTVLVLFGAVKLHETDNIFLEGLKMMASIGFVMIAAQGFAKVLTDSGQIAHFVETASAILQGHKGLTVFIMLFSGLLITLGIGSSFSTVPIIAVVFVPMGMALSLSPTAIACLVGTAGALGDAGSPVSESTLGPTAGLNADGQHDHIKDSVIPTFIHFNIPLLIFGWLGVMLLA